MKIWIPIALVFVAAATGLPTGDEGSEESLLSEDRSGNILIPP